MFSGHMWLMAIVLDTMASDDLIQALTLESHLYADYFQNDVSGMDLSSELQTQITRAILDITPQIPNGSEVAQSCPTLCDPMDCSLPGSSIHGFFQARILECVAISFSKYLIYISNLSSSKLNSWSPPNWLFPISVIGNSIISVTQDKNLASTLIPLFISDFIFKLQLLWHS